jgi:hypothetical protein
MVFIHLLLTTSLYMLDWFMVITPSSSYGYVWGKGETLDAAKAACKKNGAKSLSKRKVYAIHKDTYINDFGETTYPTIEDRPKIIEDTITKAK